jgi:fructosamine-3-kinase
MFAAEAEGLRALAAPNALRVPPVIAHADAHGDAPAFLLLEYVEPGQPGPDYAARLGEGLAALHRTATSATEASPRSGRDWGWSRDNFIGSLEQPNAPSPTWGAFWRDRRLAPQLALARARGHFVGTGGRVLDRVVEEAEVLLAAVADERPSLLHGDLWGGNVYADLSGAPVLIDPAAYRGHREVDHAMSELFGGFPGAWPTAYHEAWPHDAANPDHRRARYQRNNQRVHGNLFGGGYEPGCVRAANDALRGA